MGTANMRVLFAVLQALVAVTALTSRGHIVGNQADALGEAEGAIRASRISDCAKFIEDQHQDITAVLYFLKQGPEASHNEKNFCTQMIARGMSHDSTNCHALFAVAKNEDGFPLTLANFADKLGGATAMKNPATVCNSIIPEA